MNDNLVASWLVCGAFMIVFLGVGLSVLSIANVPSLQKLRILSGMILIRPFVDVNIAATSWVLMGWAMANGGDTNLFVGVHEFATVGTVNYHIWFFQLSLLFVSLSIVSGATLPLVINGHARLAISLFHAIAIFPPLFHWVWTSWGWASPYRSTYRDDLLLDCGVIDTAGASVIHMSAGCTGLVMHWLLSRRRYQKDSIATAIHHMVEQVFSQKKKTMFVEQNDDLDIPVVVNYMETFTSMGGSLFLWMGFIGLNVATNLPAQDATYVGGRRLIMTVVAGAAAFVIGFMAMMVFGVSIRHRTTLVMKCFASGMVAIRAASIGIVAAFLCLLISRLQHTMSSEDKLYDASEMAVSVHFVNGAWGLIAAGLLTSQTGYASTYADAYADSSEWERSYHCNGAFYGGNGIQLGAQCVFVLAVQGWCICTMTTFVWLLQMAFPTCFLESHQRPESDAPVRFEIDDEVSFQTNRDVEGNTVAIWSIGRVVKVYHDHTYDIAYDDMIEGIEKIQSRVDEYQMRVWHCAYGGHHEIAAVDNRTMKQEDLPFQLRYGYSWDYAIVLPYNDNQDSKNNGKTTTSLSASADLSENTRPPYTLLEVQKALERAGDQLETCMFYSADRTQVIIKIRGSVKGFRRYARESGYTLELDEAKCHEAASKGSEGVRPFIIADGISYGATQFRPYETLFVPYDRKSRLLVANKVYPLQGEDHPFSSIHRLKLLYAILTSNKEFCCNLDMDRLMNGDVSACFPLHSKTEQTRLRKEWLSLFVAPWEQPNSMIREYFGEHVGMYFKFLAYYTSCVGLASIVGMGCTVHVIVDAVAVTGSLFQSLETVYSIPAFSLFIAVWSKGLVDHWKQTEAEDAFRWGMDTFEETEENRKEFEEHPHHERVLSFIDGSVVTIYPTKYAKRTMFLSIVITTFFIMLAIAAVAGVFALKVYLVNTVRLPSGQTLVDFVNYFQITILSSLYGLTSTWLNDQENCRTDVIYEDSMIIKLFAFNVINSYAALFYIAFIKETVGDPCLQNSCVGELSQTLLIVFGTHLVLSPVNQLLVVQLTHFFKNCYKSGQKLNNRTVQAVEQEFYLNQYREADVISDYNTRALQFGYITLFVTAVPFAPLVAFVSNFLEIRIDGYKLLNEYRRPFPSGREDIGSWYYVFKTISFAAVFTNAAIVFHTGKYFAWIPGIKQLAGAGIAVIIVFALRMVYSYFIGGETPHGVEMQKQRREHVVKKLIEKLPDPPNEFDEDGGGGGYGDVDSYYTTTLKLFTKDDDAMDNGHDATYKKR